MEANYLGPERELYREQERELYREQGQADGEDRALPSPFMSPMYQYGSSINTLTDPGTELYKMELTFRSMRMDKDGNPVSAGTPLMNDYGISSVIGTIQSVVNQVTIMSTLTKTEIPNLMDFLGDTLAKDLMVNTGEYEIQSYAARDKIYFMALTTAFITMKRAFDEGISDKKFWRGSVQEVYSKVDAGRQKGGFLSAMNPFSNK